MKKIISLVLMIAMLFSVSAFADEEFTLHSGVKFGMTKEEINEAESSNGFTTSTSKYWPNRISVSGVVAGIESSVIIYSVDDDGSMFKATYFLGNNTASDAQRLSEYTTIQQALEEKYGSSMYNSDNMQMADVPNELFGEETTGFSFAQYEGHIQRPEVEQYNQWLLDADDGSKILIDHFLLKSDAMYQYIFYVNFNLDSIEDETQISISDDL